VSEATDFDYCWLLIVNNDWAAAPAHYCRAPSKNALHFVRVAANYPRYGTNVSSRAPHGSYARQRDDMTGFPAHGAALMQSLGRHRAKIIGGRLDILPSAAGTTLNLLLPVS
jgi:hypothetical protein